MPPRLDAQQVNISNNGFSLLNMKPSPLANNGNKKQSPEWREAAAKFKLTTSTIGLDEEYLLAGKQTKSTSGKSNIWEAYRANEDGLPAGEPPVCVKVSSNLEAVSREYENYRKLSFLGIARGRFVKCYEFFPVAGYDQKFRSQCALVMEMGARDLKSYLNSKGKLEGKELRDATISAAQCVQALHSAGLVWTDLKTENFVVMPNGEVKGIDLESAMPATDNPVDYSPEACPPEFAESFLAGDAPYFQLDYSYDIWSLGMMFLELATGDGYFDGKSPAQITKILRDSEEDIRLDDVDCEDSLKDLMRRCLQRDPKRRPNMAQILLHPYFIAGPLGPFSFLQNMS
jgi:serine/threonine protein kinase